MTKKIAVLVKGRQSEALRMSLGLTLLDDVVDIFVLGATLQHSDDNALQIATVREMGMKLYTDCPENADMELLSAEEIARRLLEYDHVLPY